jgi:3-deoxy-D-manno-octulosonic-acid transferase
LKIMFIIYDLIFLLFTIVYLPIYVFKRKFHPGFSLRLGFLPPRLELNRPIWIHAVSVGEVMAIRSLAEELKKNYPNRKLVISTVTPTGNRIAKGIAQEGDFVTYLPLDLSFIVRHVIDKIRPCVFIIAETEIWPNLISYLFKQHIPIIAVNGRISDSSFKGYLTAKFLIKNILEKVNLFCVQTDRDAQRLKALGILEEKIKITGNMKFDATDYRDRNCKDPAELKKKLGLTNEDQIFIAASTHKGEEEIILNVYARLLEEFPTLNLILAPRHPERSREVEKIALGFRFCTKLVSKLPQPIVCATKTVFVLDVIGELINFYNISDIVFVGGSLIKKGGHNILEPAALAKPILFGPHMFNFRDIADLFLFHKGALLLNGQEEIISKIAYLLRNSSIAAEFGERAKQLIKQNQGATARNLGFIRKFLV